MEGMTLLTPLLLVLLAIVTVDGQVPNPIPFQIPQTNGRTGMQQGVQQFPPDIFQMCFKEAQIPMDVALGNYFQYPILCSRDFYQMCRTQLPIALQQSVQLYPNQRDYVMSHLLSWVDGGGRFLCSTGQQIIQAIMQNGGRDCVQSAAALKLAHCQQSLDTLNSGLTYSDGYCGAQDNTMQCFIDAVNLCPNIDLRDFLWDFFKSVSKVSPCAGVSRFTNSAPSFTSGIKTTTTAIVSVSFVALLVKGFFS